MAETETNAVDQEVVNVPDLVHPDDGDMDARVPFNDWLDYAGENHPEVDLMHFYQTREIRNKAVETSADKKFTTDYDAAVTVSTEMMDANNSKSIAINKETETNFQNKKNQESILNSGNAVAIAKAQDNLGLYESTKAGDWDIDLGREVTQEDLIVKGEGKVAEWEVTKYAVGFDHIPYDVRHFAHPNGVSVDGMTVNLFNSEDLSEQQIDKKYSVGVQVIDIANNNFNRLQQDLIDSFTALDKKQKKSQVGKNIQQAWERNLAINTKKIEMIRNLYQMDIGRKKAYDYQSMDGQDYKTLSNGITAQQVLIDDLNESIVEMTPGSDKYKQAYSEMQTAIEQKLMFKDKWHRSFTFNIEEMIANTPSDSLGEAYSKIANKLPGYMLDMVQGVGGGLAEGVVNNTWELITDITSAVKGESNDNPWKLIPKGDRESALYNVTSILTEYISPFFATRGLMAKADEVTKDLVALAITGAWLKPKDGNIIHFVNQLNDEELDWLAKIDVVPKDGDPALDKLKQRLSSAGQEFGIGALIWGVVLVNKLGGAEVWSRIKAQKKHKTFMDTSIQRLTGIDLFQKRVTRLKTRAKLYTESGMDAAQVFNKTGQIQEPDGNWHFRGDYSKGKWKDLDYGSWRLGDLLDDATLYGHIPEAKNVSIVLTKSKVKGQVSAEYRPGSNTIYIHADSLEGRVVKSKIWHEIQHATDTSQGFAAGGAPKDFNDELKAAYNQYDLDMQALENSPQMLAIKAKMAKRNVLNKKDLAILGEVNNQSAVLRAERDAKLSIKGRKKDNRTWYGPEDFSNRNATATRLYTRLVGERRANHIEATWDLPFDQVRFDATEVYKDAIYHTPGNVQMAEASHVVNQINADLKAVGASVDELPTNEKAMFELLESGNPHAALVVNKVVTDTLVDGYTQAVIKLGDKNFGVSHIVDIHMSPTARCKGKACKFEDPRDVLSVIDMIRKVKPQKVWDKKAKEFKLEYTIRHEGKDAYKLVIKENKTPLDSKGKPRLISGGKNKGKPIKGENTVVTFHPVDGFKDISVRDLLDKVADSRTVNVQKQFSIDDASAIIADVADKPLSVQSKLLSAQIGSTKDPVIKARIIERVKVINSEIKTNKQTNVKVSILEDLKTVEWNNQVYSKLENIQKQR